MKCITSYRSEREGEGWGRGAVAGAEVSPGARSDCDSLWLSPVEKPAPRGSRQQRARRVRPVPPRGGAVVTSRCSLQVKHFVNVTAGIYFTLTTVSALSWRLGCGVRVHRGLRACRECAVAARRHRTGPPGGAGVRGTARPLLFPQAAGYKPEPSQAPLVGARVRAVGSRFRATVAVTVSGRGDRIPEGRSPWRACTPAQRRGAVSESRNGTGQEALVD